MTYIPYAGIGSRETEDWALEQLRTAAANFAQMGLTLRSGGADGADTACEQGCNSAGGAKEIFLPWPRFNGNGSCLVDAPPLAYEVAAAHHPAWNRLPQSVRKFMARSSCQVLGADCQSPSRFILCWTPDGKGGGGTGQALRIAKTFSIPVFDLGRLDNLDQGRRIHALGEMGAQIMKLIHA